MPKQVLGFVMCAGVLLTGCVHPLRPARVCAEWRWIGIKSASTASCPAPGAGWEAQQLFAEPGERPEPNDYEQPNDYRQPQANEPQQSAIKPADRAAAMKAVAELDRFCVYEPTKPAGRPRYPPFASAAEAAKVGLERVDRDCAAISASSPVDLSRVWMPDMSDQFLSQAGRPAAMNIRNERGVRLAFLDTQPDGDDVPHLLATSLHGYTLAHIARRLVCSGENLESLAPCAAQITTRLAMPFRRFDPDRPSLNDIDRDLGGTIGSQTDLATAITDEVRAWQRDPAAPRHLVLNLSLGWDPRQIEGFDESSRATLDAGTQSVLTALRYASSLDVLVLAAAGNQKLCSYQDGPLRPAEWEGGVPGEAARVPPTAPLVYAVGGVTSDGSRLSNARPRSMPPRTACGESGVVTTWGPEFTTWLYTGSSVATAVVSSTAAVVWDILPTLSSAQVMDVVTQSGNELGFNADFGFGGDAAPKSRRVSLCAAVRQACNRPEFAGDCPIQSPCPSWGRQDTLFPTWVVQPLGAACHWWVVPQPDELPCPPCNPRP